MPTLPLATLEALPLVDYAVRDRADVLALLPKHYKRALSAPVRDAIIDGLFALLREYEDRAAYATLQADVKAATGDYLVGQASDRGFAPAEGETDPAFRERVLTPGAVCSPDAIREAVALILSPFTTKSAQLFDSVLDRWFVANWANNGIANPAWHSFIGTGPKYPVREHEANRDPGGAWSFRNQAGRHFVLRVPELGSLNNTPAFVFSTPGTPSGFYVGGGTSGLNTTYIYKNATTAFSVYQAIVNVVNRMAPQGVRWRLHVDPKL